MKTLRGLDRPLLDLAGRPIIEDGSVPVQIGTLAANVIARAQSPDAIRAMDIAFRVYKCPKSLEIEDADYAVLEEAVKKDVPLTNLARAQILHVLNGRESETKSADK